MSSFFRIEDLNLDIISHILQFVFVDVTDEERLLYQYNIANAGIISLLNSIIDNSTIGTNLFDFIDTRLWLVLLVSMGIIEITSFISISPRWIPAIKEYNARIIREHMYTSRVHDLIDIMHSTRIHLSIRNVAKYLLYELITENSNEIERQFLCGNKLDSILCTNETIQDLVQLDIELIKYWDVRQVTLMKGLFSSFYHDEPKQIDLTYWNTKNVTDMSEMFQQTNATIIGITYWNTSKVLSMASMFEDAMLFNQPLIWNTSNVIDMRDMFSGARMFNQSLNGWNTSQVTDMTQMFNEASLFNQPLFANIGNVITMTGMFCKAISFNQSLDNWKSHNLMSMEGMFEQAHAFNQHLNHLDTSKVTVMRNMFSSAHAFNQPLNKWDTSQVEDMSSMFYDAIQFNQPLPWDINNVKDMSYMFKDAFSFTQDLDWNIDNEVDVTDMFCGTYGALI
jgi:surface protein